MGGGGREKWGGRGRGREIEIGNEFLKSSLLSGSDGPVGGTHILLETGGSIMKIHKAPVSLP